MRADSSLLMGETLENIARGCIARPCIRAGRVRGNHAVQLSAMVPLWMFPVALPANTFVLSEREVR